MESFTGRGCASGFFYFKRSSERGEPMDKNTILVGGSILVIAIAGFFIFRQTTGGGGGPTTIGTLVKCKACGYSFETDAQEAVMTPPQPVKCPKCGKVDCLPAVKCDKCGFVFIASQKMMKKKPDGGMGLQCPKCKKFVQR